MLLWNTSDMLGPVAAILLFQVFSVARSKGFSKP